MTTASGESLAWLRRRLGSAGSGRLRILERIRELVPELGSAGGPSLGLSAAELASLATAHRLRLMAQRFVWRGDADRLQTVAWWGSAIADVALDEQRADRGCVLREAAAFNLGVALFDSVVENAPEQAASLAQALDPRRMRSRLSSPENCNSEIRCGDQALDLIGHLFDAVLSSAGRRFGSNPVQRDYLSELLGRMYRSELGLSSEPFFAKVGPVLFIGALTRECPEESLQRLFEALARFCQLWDDWQDLEEDIRHLAPNAYLGAPSGASCSGAVAYALRSLGRVAGGRLCYAEVTRTLADALRAVVVKAADCAPGTYRKTILLCHELVG